MRVRTCPLGLTVVPSDFKEFRLGFRVLLLRLLLCEVLVQLAVVVVEEATCGNCRAQPVTERSRDLI